MRITSIIAAVAVSMVCVAGLICAQDEAAPAAVAESAEPAVVTPAAVSSPQPMTKDESIYGEVLSVNAAANSMTIQYYDYDTDEEKSLEIVVGGDTKMENAKELADVKSGDWVDVSYAAGVEGKKIAKSVKVEKAEEPVATGAGADEGGY